MPQQTQIFCYLPVKKNIRSLFCTITIALHTVATPHVCRCPIIDLWTHRNAVWVSYKRIIVLKFVESSLWAPYSTYLSCDSTMEQENLPHELTLFLNGLSEAIHSLILQSLFTIFFRSTAPDCSSTLLRSRTHHVGQRKGLVWQAYQRLDHFRYYQSHLSTAT